MQIVLSLLIGYLLGSLSPSALLSKLKNVNFRENGSKNLGASNTMLLLGKGYGALVMVIDIAKAFLAAVICRHLFPELAVAGMLAAFAAEVGHIFPFYMKFKGGKGLAAFGGLVLFYNGWMFLALLVLGVILMLIFNCSWVMPMSASVLFVIMVALDSRNLTVTAIALAAAVLIVIKHWSNIEKARSGKEVDIRGLFGNNNQKISSAK
jgi:glycerol-3-phosphate acyltransferase PlsY